MTEQSSEHFDVVIVGAGINGAGIARDASLRGLRVLLLDKNDIGSGTSSFSTRLIHGGLRYLEHAEFGLVKESLRERETLLKIAPHLVRQLPILIPIYKGMKRSRSKIRIGMIAYDLLSLGKSLPHHRALSRAEALKQVPALNEDNLLGAVVYYDAQVEFAERLVFENVLAAVENGATVITHARVENFLTEANRVIGLAYRVGKSAPRIAQASLIVNAAGPWIDTVLENIERSSDKLIGGTKGSHIVVAPFPGSSATAIYIEAQSDGRPFFIIPWNGYYLIGTTDVRFENNPDEARIEKWEVDYLLEETNRTLPNARLSTRDVLYAYSGVRPLPYTKDNNESGITRMHFIRQHPRLQNVVSIVGGKLTTYRSLAEECVDLLFQKMEKSSPECRTSELPLPGAREFETFGDDFKSRAELSSAARNRLLRIYGSRAEEVIKFGKGHGLSEYLDNEQTTLAAEIPFSFENELAGSLTDCLMRRTMLGLERDLGQGKVEAAVTVVKKFENWSDNRVDSELQDYYLAIRQMQSPFRLRDSE